MPGIRVNPDDLVLDLLGVAGELLFKLGVAQYMGVGLQRVCDLLLLGWGEHGARGCHVSEAKGEGCQHDGAGERQIRRLLAR
jgi:hypothetical protein